MFGSSNWTEISKTYLPNRTPNQIMRWWLTHKEEGRKSFWTEDEDETLKFAVEKYKTENGGENMSWSKISKMIEDRTANQCEVRWSYILDPNITKKGRWSCEEEMQLLEIVRKYKITTTISSTEEKKKRSIWPLIAKELNNGRSETSCRMKYTYMQRRS